MSSPKHADDVGAAPRVEYGTDAFDRALRRVLAEETGHDPGARLLLYGGTREGRQHGLATLTRHTSGNVHQFRVPSLLAERRMQTQNNLRKAFDHAAEESALLYFDSADALFAHTHVDEEDAEDQPEPNTVEYFFDRVVAYDGVVVLAAQRENPVERAQEHVDLVVEFE